ncbi:MAG: hypothetical protein GWN07_06590, partial [Actinobacteria bacterium]|nr:hypothetical protein [Actinomycetota bacterium]NIS29855.1 hypothetical protein [Actinomycetota bacterium]NIU65153.1 hypothetical protein [Actinomycetota bacterium]NIV86201.1 hypothetical protein [Actinomycetota bacterium]NIX19513.1 hypothetical protein [Actinomycetota bacterium]
MEEEQALAEALADTWGHGAPEAGEHPSLFLDLSSRLASRPTLDMPPVPTGPADEQLVIRGLDATPGDAEAVSGAIDRLVRKGT